MNKNYEEAKKYNELGNTCKNSHDFKKALKYYLKAAKFMPLSPIILANLGVTYNHLGKIEIAQKYFQNATRADPNYADVYYNQGKIYLEAEKYNFAIKFFEKAVKINPKFEYAKSLLSYSKMQICDWGNQPKYDYSFDTPLLNILRSDNPSINLKVAQIWSQAVEEKMANYPKFAHKKQKKEKLTIGYLSCDFYDHATSYLMADMFKYHNKKTFVIHVYSYGQNDRNNYLRKIKKDCDKLTDISKLGDFEAAQKIYSNNVDILIDLKGYTGGARMEILALKPAPIQISYLGFPGTTGATFINYLITDKIVSPPNHKKYYSEKLVYMPDSYQVNDAGRKISTKKYSRRDFSLPEDAFVFCSFNQPTKIEPKVFSVWMKILRSVPKSVLWLWKDNDLMVRNLKKEALKARVDPARLVFGGNLPNDKHLARLRLADLALDTFVYNGHTTTSDCLWAGVPVVTLKGNHFASRVSASLLTAMGLFELITHSPKEYEKLAISLANNPKKLANIHESLILNRESCALFDTQKFVKNLEKAYQFIWNNYLSGKKPRPFLST